MSNLNKKPRGIHKLTATEKHVGKDVPDEIGIPLIWARIKKMAFEHFDTTSRPVMNPPADEAEARNRANTAPRQADSAAVGREMAGPLTESEARPVMPTAQDLCEDCPPVDYSTDTTRCTPCPRRTRCPNMGHKRYDMRGCTECTTSNRGAKS